MYVDYRPPAAHDKGPLADGEAPATFRYPAGNTFEHYPQHAPALRRLVGAS